MQNNEDIEQFFEHRLYDAEVSPSDDIWSRLQSNLDKKNVEGIYQTAFQNATVQPSASVWKKIATVLTWRSFFTFHVNTFNVYYASILSAIIGISLFHFTSRTNTKEDDVTPSQANIVTIDSISTKQKQNIENEEVIITNVQTSPQISHEASIHKETPLQITTPTMSSSEEKSPKKRKDEISNTSVDWSHVHIVGATSVCEDVPAIYTVEGLNAHADIRWSLPKSAKKQKEAGTMISIQWKESGNQKMSACIEFAGEKKTVDYEVTVENVSIPVIKGKNRVCQGTEKQLYSVEETINKEVSYFWDTKINPLDQFGNKYVTIDWEKSGKDTLTVVKVNNVTGCKSKASMPIVVCPQPKISFDISPLGDSEYELAFTETQRNGYTYEWSIEGMEYDEPIVTHTATGAGSSFVTLTVTDKNHCTSSLKKEIDFDKNFIAVPSKFIPSNGKYFIPLTNSELTSYKFEIYNAKNEKIWETTELDHGKPAIGWDGKYKGARLARGKYLWKISATFEDGTKWNGVTQPNGTCRPSGVFVLEE